MNGPLENKYNLSQANIVQDSSTAVDLRNPDSSPGRTPYAGNVLNSIEIEDNSRSPGSVQFTSLVSAAFWLVYCPNWMSSDVISLVDQIYKVLHSGKHSIFREDTVFPHIVAAATILFWEFECGNYSREETVQRRKLLISCFLFTYLI